MKNIILRQVKHNKIIYAFSTKICPFLLKVCVIKEGVPLFKSLAILADNSEMVAAVGEDYKKLKSAFDNYQTILRKTVQKKKELRPKRQASLLDMFSKAGSLKSF